MRRAARSIVPTLIAVAVLVAVSAPATAQVPACTTIALSHAAPPVLDPGASGSVTVNVANEGPLNEAVVSVRTQIGDGWSVEPREANVTVGSGETESVTLTVTAPDRHDARGDLNVTADGLCSVGGMAPPGPLADLARTNTATDTLQLRTVDASAFQFPDFLNVAPEYVLGGLGVAAVLGGAFYAMRRKGAGFHVKAAEPEKTLRAGRGTSFPVEVANRGREPETAVFRVGDVPDGWNAFMAVPEVTLAGGESRTVWLMVRAPQAATTGSAAIVNLAVVSRDDPKRESRVAVRAEIRDDAGGPDDDVDATRPA